MRRQFKWGTTCQLSGWHAETQPCTFSSKPLIPCVKLFRLECANIINIYPTSSYLNLFTKKFVFVFSVSAIRERVNLAVNKWNSYYLNDESLLASPDRKKQHVTSPYLFLIASIQPHHHKQLTTQT